MFGYGVLKFCACARQGTSNTATSTMVRNANVLRVLGFIVSPETWPLIPSWTFESPLPQMTNAATRFLRCRRRNLCMFANQELTPPRPCQVQPHVRRGGAADAAWPMPNE